jgi:hypothetical protein
MTNGTRSCKGVSVTPRPLFTPRKNPVPNVQKAVWAPGPVWTGAEDIAPPGFDLRTVQPVASHYTNSATRPTREFTFLSKFRENKLGNNLRLRRVPVTTVAMEEHQEL